MGFGFRMTFRALSAFFFISLVLSITADPTGLKLRITNRALDVLKDFGLEFLQTLVNHPFPDFTAQVDKTTITIKGLKLTHLDVDRAQTAISFQEDSGLQFEIKDLTFSGELVRDISVSLFRKLRISKKNVLFSGRGVRAKIEVELYRNPQGRLNVEIPTCEVRADDITTGHSGITGWLWDKLKPLYKLIFNNKLCPAVQRNVVPKINNMLDSLTMTAKLYELQNRQKKEKINIDYSLSDDVTVTSDCLDVPFKGVIFRQEETFDLNSIKSRRDPVFSESNRMAYVGVSEFFFNSAAMSLYKAGPFQFDLPKVPKVIKKLVMGPLGISKGPITVKLTKAPIIRITKNGVSATVNAEAKSLAAKRKPILPVVCQLNMKVNIKGNRLILLFERSTRCKVKPRTLRGKLVGWMVNLASKNKLKVYLNKKFQKGVLIPLPEGVDFTEAKIDYHDGFLVIGGNLNFTPAGRKKVLKRIGR